MSSEVCPFCGKSYKRLKTHLPHCKAAPNSKTPPGKPDVSKSTSSVASGFRNVPVSSSELVQPPPPPLATSPSAQKKKPKLADHLQTTTSLPPPSPPSNPAVPKPKKKSLRALIEAAKSERATGGTPSGQLSFSPLSPTVEITTETKTKPDGESLKFMSADVKHKAKKKVSKSKKASQLLESKVDESNSKPRTRDNFWVGEEEEEEVERLVMNSGGGSQVRITLQSVKATLGRANGARPNRSADGLRSEIRLDARELNDAVKAAAPWGQLQPPGNKDPKSEQPPSIQLHGDAPPQPHTGPPVGPPPSEVAGLLATSPALRRLSSPLRFPLPPQSLPVRAAAALQLEAGKQNTAEKPAEAVRSRTTQPSLGQVALRDLPEWLARRTPAHPREVVEMLQRGWRWYYRRYIDVKKGGVAGVGMLLAGYCTLSYIWTYPHTKLDRWRKYH